MTSRLARHDGLLSAIMLVLAVTHAAVGLLHALHLAAPGRRPIPSSESVLQAIALVDAPQMWTVWHVATALLLVAAVVARGLPLRRSAQMLVGVVALALSVCSSLIWGVPLLIWSWALDPPGSLVAPVLLVCLHAPIAALCLGAVTEQD